MEGERPAPEKRAFGYGIPALVATLAWVKSQMHALSRAEILGFAALALIAFFVETRASRPRQTYFRLAIVSALLFDVLVISVAQLHGSLGLSSLTWLVMTILGLVLAITYERTEPLP